MMSKELLKALTDVLDDLKLRKNLNDDDALNISDSVLVKAENAVESYLAQPEQEPVVWKVVDKTTGDFMFSRVKPLTRTYLYAEVIPLYASPPTVSL
jgi:hypothetical protein